MGRFVIHGILIEEPNRTVTSNGIDCITLLVEEKVRTVYSKEIINTYNIEFMGKGTNCFPDNVRLVGCPVVVTGTITSREYKGRYYNDLKGDTLTIIDTGISALSPTPKEDGVAGVGGSNLDTLDIAEDDLPF